MRILPKIVFAIAVALGGSALAGTSAKAPPAVQAEFAAFLARFGAALKANDAAAIAGMAKLPFQGDAGVSDAAQFAAKIYKDSLTAKNRACIRRGKAVYARSPDSNDTYAIFCGDLIFTFTRTPQGFLFTDIDMND